MTNRILKLLFLVIKHGLTIDKEVLELFNEITKYSEEKMSQEKQKLTKAFGLSIKRMK